ncbi:BnaC06g00140D [Brassica napus]|uniref:BnaC06g00140D protein n=1 Tax=Brassica napus TaxID=3708 RepID=A0A078FVX9_BRANA|nr:BnaC06g00140D [Brassica napus]
MPPFLFEDGRVSGGFVHIWIEGIHNSESVNEIVMESKYGKKKSSSSSSSLFYEAPLGYSIEDVRPNGGIKKFKSLSTPTALLGHPDSVSAWFPNFIVLSSYYKFRQQGDMALSAIGFEVTRSRPRSQLDKIHTPAACEIVSSLSNDHFDSCILSESSFFVYPYKVIIKTCGTTKLLLSIPPLLNLAG